MPTLPDLKTPATFAGNYTLRITTSNVCQLAPAPTSYSWDVVGTVAGDGSTTLTLPGGNDGVRVDVTGLEPSSLAAQVSVNTNTVPGMLSMTMYAYAEAVAARQVAGRWQVPSATLTGRVDLLDPDYNDLSCTAANHTWSLMPR
jgi:hypothetical protein